MWAQEKVMVLTTDEGQTGKRILLSGPSNSQDRVKLKEHDHSYQHLSCTNSSSQPWNSQLVKKIN